MIHKGVAQETPINLLPNKDNLNCNSQIIIGLVHCKSEEKKGNLSFKTRIPKIN